MKPASKPTILIIIGITGDLSKRRLLPAIEQIVKAKAAPAEFKVLGVSRRQVAPKQLLQDVPSAKSTGFLSRNLRMHRMGLVNLDDYKDLKARLMEIEKDFAKPAQWLFYLSVPPNFSNQIIKLLGESGIAARRSTKLLVEKPFGVDLSSARSLIRQTKRHFQEDQIYRIDHYMAKEMAQNFIVFRSANPLFKNTWNKHFIDRIEVIASEKIGVEGRSTFYEQTGALRDLVQSHLLQLAALTLMKIPQTLDLSDIPRLRKNALKKLRIPAAKPVAAYARRGQYQGYREEVDNPATTTETFADITLESADPKWKDVPIRLMTGKALKEKITQIRVIYKKDISYESNELIIRLQPDEGVTLELWSKAPAYEWRAENRLLKLAFKDPTDILPEAYERVFLDAINSNRTFFTSSEEVVESWRILEPVLQAWKGPDQDLYFYKKGAGIKVVAGKKA